MAHNLGRLYLAGPMTGITDFNYPKFVRWTEYLRGVGYDVVSPVEIGNKYGTAEQLSKNDSLLSKVIDEELAEIPKCDYIFLLNGWENSIGARDELVVAIKSYLKILIEGRDL